MLETGEVSQVHGKSLSFPRLVNVMNRKICAEDKSSSSQNKKVKERQRKGKNKPFSKACE